MACLKLYLTTLIIFLYFKNASSSLAVGLQNSEILTKNKSLKANATLLGTVGSSVTLRCPNWKDEAVVDSGPSWQFNNSSIDFVKLKPRLRIIGGKLMIKYLQKSDAGFYSCVECREKESGCQNYVIELIVQNKANKETEQLSVNSLAKTKTKRDAMVVEMLKTKIRQRRSLSRNATTAGATKAQVTLRKFVGEFVELGCPVWRREQSTNATWKLNDSLISSNNLEQRFTIRSRSLRLENLQLEDAGNYSCEVCDLNGICQMHKTQLVVSLAKRDEQLNEALATTQTTTETIVVRTTTPLIITSEEPPQTVGNNSNSNSNEDTKTETKFFAPRFTKLDKTQNHIVKLAGSSVQIFCTFEGNPAPNITWTVNGTDINRKLGIVRKKKYSILLEDIITVDAGIYKCQVCNELGCIEHETKLNVIERIRSPPIHSDRFPMNQTVLVNTNALFECRVISDLSPSFVWVRYLQGENASIRELEDSVPILPSGGNLTHRGQFDILPIPTDAEMPHILNLTKVTHADEGWYTCLAANSLGQSLASAYLHVVDEWPKRGVYTLLKAHPTWAMVIISVVVLLFVVGAILMVCVLRKLKNEKLLKQRIETVHQWTKRIVIYRAPSCDSSSCDLQMPIVKIEKKRTTFTAPANGGGESQQAFNEYEFPLDANWEIPRNQLQLGETLGEGAFGRVVMAEAYGLNANKRMPQTKCGSDEPVIVAVKMVKDEHTDADMASLVREMEVMKLIGRHINIINLLACCSQNGPLWVVVEYAPHGNLKDFLKQNRPMFHAVGSTGKQRFSDYCPVDTQCDGETTLQLTEKKLVSFAFQIARGMEYLASRKCIHRDLAARNVLVSDDYVMKIADFGLARDIQDTDYYRKNSNGRLPIKWMAPESLQDKFYDSKSDVWAYGILLWEIMTYGEQPYPNIICAEELYSYLINGQRMEKPPRCSLNIYMLMRQCWHFEPAARPTFVEIVENLDKILQLAQNTLHGDYLDLSTPMLETPPSSSDEADDCDADDEGGQRSCVGDFSVSNDRTPLQNSIDRSNAAKIGRYQYTYKFN